MLSRGIVGKIRRIQEEEEEEEKEEVWVEEERVRNEGE